MNFTHDFAGDLRKLDFRSPEPWALVRFADGERAILLNRKIKTADGWDVPEPESSFTRLLWDSFEYDAPDWHVGYACPCCDPDGSDWLRRNSPVPPERQTFSNIFANANWGSAFARIGNVVSESTYVSNDISTCGSWIEVPARAANEQWSVQGVVHRLIEDRRTGPILLAAGPASNIIGYIYWTTCPPEKRRIICDIGSTLDPETTGRATRGYHHSNSPTSGRVCQWTLR